VVHEPVDAGSRTALETDASNSGDTDRPDQLGQKSGTARADPPAHQLDDRRRIARQAPVAVPVATRCAVR